MAAKRSRQAFEADSQKQASPYELVGTPLPQFDENTRDDGSFVPVWKQEVLDDRGRKRLHGAFTGGFSAGYYNTVGSKEGWTPSTFISSRQNRSKDVKKTPAQKPEDFMDEEDLREAEEERNLSTMDGFTGFGTTQDDPKRLGGLMDIFRPTGETIGVQLLKRMGWRQGQGIGPKVRRQANLDGLEAGSDQKHLFAPENPPIISFARKTDHKGLGFEGEDRLEQSDIQGAKQGPEEDSVLRRLEATSGKREKQKKSSFGVGILNDTGSDDEDPYEIGPRISYSSTLGGDKKNKKRKESGLKISNPLVQNKPVFMSKKLPAGAVSHGFRKCHDGRLPIEGFTLSDNSLDSFASMSLRDDRYKPPEVPPNWKSSKSPAASDEQKPTYVSPADAAKASNFNAKARAALLGESQLPGKSVFDFVTPATRAKLVAVSGRTNLPTAGSEKAPADFENPEEADKKSLEQSIPQLDREVAMQALKRGIEGWMPYAEDLDKRARYQAYLEWRAGLHEELPAREPGMKRDDWLIELHEFARAAQVFKPITGLMASRFTSSTAQPHDGGPNSNDPDSLLHRPSAKPEDPAEAAARIGMFGLLTRSFQNFYPTKLLCKRFEVTQPDHVRAGEETGSMSNTGRQATDKSGFPGEVLQATGSTKANSPAPVPNAESIAQSSSDGSVTKPTINADRNEALEQERPGQAVFKAIFGDDSDEEDTG